jgi:hypothetical protein
VRERQEIQEVLWRHLIAYPANLFTTANRKSEIRNQKSQIPMPLLSLAAKQIWPQELAVTPLMSSRVLQV